MLTASPSPTSADNSTAGTSAGTAFAAAVLSSHTATLRCEVWNGAQYLTTLYPTDGSVEVDARRSVRRSLSMTVVDTDGTLLPTSETALLSPFAGNEVLVWRGVRFNDGSVAEVPLGVFRITHVAVQTGDEGTQLSISGEDRSWTIARRKFKSTFPVADNTNITTAIANVMADRAPEFSTAGLAATDYTLTALVPGISSDVYADPWQFCQQLALAAGQELFIDPYGVIATQTITDLSNTQTVAEFTTDRSSGVLLDLQREFSVEGVYNTVVLTVEGTGVGARGWQVTVTDNDSNSPSRVSLYGEAPYELSTPFIKGSASDTEQTSFVAGKVLQTVMGQPFTFTCVPNPALDVRDVVRVQNTTVGVDTRAVVDSITIPFGASEPMTVNARALTL